MKWVHQEHQEVMENQGTGEQMVSQEILVPALEERKVKQVTQVHLVDLEKMELDLKVKAILAANAAES